MSFMILYRKDLLQNNTTLLRYAYLLTLFFLQIIVVEMEFFSCLNFLARVIECKLPETLVDVVQMVTEIVRNVSGDALVHDVTNLNFKQSFKYFSTTRLKISYFVSFLDQNVDVIHNH